MCKDPAVIPKPGVLHFGHAYLHVQLSPVMLGKLSHPTSDFETLSPYPFGIKGRTVALK